MRSVLRRPSPATVISLIALFVALGGTSYAAISISGKNVKNGSLSGADVKNNSLTGKDVKNNSLTGADVAESKLGKVKSAKGADSAKTAATATNAVNAGTLGGLAASAFARSSQDTQVATFSDPTNDCTSSGFIGCFFGSMTLRRTSRLVLLGELPYKGIIPGASTGSCRYVIDDAVLATSPTLGVSAENSYVEGYPFNAVTGPLPAGKHSIVLECSTPTGRLSFAFPTVTALAVSPN